MLKVVASAVCLLAIVLASGAASANDYCSSSGAVVVFAVDVTTPYDQTDKDAIVSVTDKILNSLRGGDKIIIRTIADSHTHSERLIQKCVPYCPAQGVIGRLFDYADGAIRTDAERMRIEVIAALRARLSNFVELKYSDIVRTIFSISSDEPIVGRPFRLYIYSDLIENSDYFSPTYLFSYSTKRLLDGLKQYKLIAPMNDAEVWVAGVGRWDSRDRRPLKVSELEKLKEFWDSYFRESGAKKISISQNPP